MLSIPAPEKLATAGSGQGRGYSGSLSMWSSSSATRSSSITFLLLQPVFFLRSHLTMESVMCTN